MYSTIVVEIVMAIGRFFMNPLLYIALMVALFIGYRRVKRERKYFNTRILSGWSEFKGLFQVGILLPLVISFISIAVGLTVSVEFLLLVSMLSIIALMLYVFHLLSPIIIFTIAFGVLVVMDMQNWTVSYFGFDFAGVSYTSGLAVTIPLLAGMVLIAEGIFIRKDGSKYATPIMEKTKRGLNAVAYFSKKIWVLPVVFIVPGSAIDAYFPWWPHFSLGAEQFTLVLFPVVIGFQQLTRRTMPLYVYPKLGRSVIILGQLVLLGGLGAYFEPLIGVGVLLLGLVARLGISISYKRSERNDSYAVIRSSRGAMIAAVLPDSPAEKMGLIAGEVIKKVNGLEVHTEDELYEALQINAAHCRLEVLDHRNEIRLTQHVVHSDDHHRIGLLLVH
ncbi:PDZ domain-containing protein [Solibacillus sp. FSL H8-0538]|uniref:PDZ domain-containing protein n=1 Tax=Solibacillus sp. FSL H8-0538 TaxID=2921400 RepID=UPI0030F94557